MTLSDLACKNAKPGPALKKLSDGGGLQLWVQPTGSRLWRLAYRVDGKQKLLAVGRYPEVSLAEARKQRDEAKALLRNGLDPSAVRQKTKLEARQAKDRPGETFREVADAYLVKQRREKRAEATLTKAEWLVGMALPDLGDRTMRDIKPADVLHVLRQVEARGRHETARRLRTMIGAIFRYAIASTLADTDPTIALKGALTEVAAKPRAAITDPKGVGALLRAIDGYICQPSTHAALRLLPLLFPRPGELRMAEWSEFDLDAATPVWTIPASRMKMRREHRIPLPAQAVAILKALHPITSRHSLVFHATTSVLRPISENTLNSALRRLGYGQDEMTAHGFRATASTLLNESGLWHPDAIERQLAHVEGNGSRRAYARGEHWDERVRMMTWWADECARLKSAPVA